MNRLLIIAIGIFFSFNAIWAQCNSEDDQKDPKKVSHEIHGYSIGFAGQISVDPNEIIGPQGYDSLQWVSINDVLNYTIYFENDPEFATANAQKVDVRFTFDDKAYIKGFGLSTFGFVRVCN